MLEAVLFDMDGVIINNEFIVGQDVSKADLVIFSLQGITWEKLKIVEENLPHSH